MPVLEDAGVYVRQPVALQATLRELFPDGMFSGLGDVWLFAERILGWPAKFVERDEGALRYPQAMDQRFGGWGRILAVSRLVYFGVSHGELHLPARQGDLFNPQLNPFLEGSQAGFFQNSTHEVPPVDDGVVHAVLSRLTHLDGHRISYMARFKRSLRGSRRVG